MLARRAANMFRAVTAVAVRRRPKHGEQLGRALPVGWPGTVVSLATWRPLATSSTFADATSADGGFATGRRWDMWNWTYYRRAFRAVRAVALAGSIYGAGYAGGLHAYSADPEGVTEGQVQEVLHGIGAVDERGKVLLCANNSEVVRRTHRVFARVLLGAREVVAELEASAVAEVEAARHRGRLAQAEAERQLEKYKRARRQLKNWSVSRGVVVADVNTPNAFVHGLIPRIIFVHRGLFDMRHPCVLESSASLGPQDVVFVRPKPSSTWTLAKVTACVSPLLDGGLLKGIKADVDLSSADQWLVVKLSDGSEAVVPRDDVCGVGSFATIQSDEQLAMLLGHELSHVIHDHMEDSVSLLAISGACQIALLAVLDPTGLFSFVVELCMGSVAKFGVLLPDSRADESEADRTGLLIAARAGYNPRDAAHFFNRMAEAEQLMTDGRGQPTWASTHPSTEERAAAIMRSEHGAIEAFERRQREASARSEIGGGSGGGASLHDWFMGKLANRRQR